MDGIVGDVCIPRCLMSACFKEAGERGLGRSELLYITVHASVSVRQVRSIGYMGSGVVLL